MPHCQTTRRCLTSSFGSSFVMNSPRGTERSFASLADSILNIPFLSWVCRAHCKVNELTRDVSQRLHQRDVPSENQIEWSLCHLATTNVRRLPYTNTNLIPQHSPYVPTHFTPSERRAFPTRNSPSTASSGLAGPWKNSWSCCFSLSDFGGNLFVSQALSGSKKSGIGREGGTWSFDFYADVKNTVYAPTGWKE